MDQEQPQFLESGDARLAYRHRPGAGPTLLFLPGYMSDMEGAKAQALDAFAARRGLACIRFDYSGTGSSEGEFEQGTLSGWLSDSLGVVDCVSTGSLILVGSSMGGWLALHIAMLRPDRVEGVV